MFRIPIVGPAALLALALALNLAACGSAPPRGTAVHPADVHNPRSESDLTTLTLTAGAVERLGIRTSPVRREAIRSTRTFGGALIVPPGRSVSVTAPVAGTLIAPVGGGMPSPGGVVAKGQQVLRLLPVAPPEQDLLRREAEEQARFDAATSRHQRAERLLRDGAGSARRLEEARADLAIAEAALGAVRNQKRLLNLTTVEGDQGPIGAWSVTSPLTGRLGALHVAPGQAVGQSTVLFEVLADDPLWVRVPVYVGDLTGIDRAEAATILGLGAAESWGAASSPGPTGIAAAPARKATWVTSPPSADPGAATVDLFFRLPNAEGVFQPGQKVAVSLVLGRDADEADSLVVPQAAILYDIHGGTWVYDNPSPGTFVRERVEVRRIVGRTAVLARGPAPGTQVVHVGAAELFGTEFGVGH